VTSSTQAPILFVDVDGVISLFDFPPELEQLPGPLHRVDGSVHCIPPAIGARLRRLSTRFELVWATGWEERANEHLPAILELEQRTLPTLLFAEPAVFGTAQWKLDAIDGYAGDRPAAWIDDSLDDVCLAWAEARRAPTLVVRTESPVGLTDDHVEGLLSWAERLG
jgi:HAD domain in Swiss Army Knife RNA repair proteins